MNRMQHIVPSGIILVAGIWIAWISYTSQPSEAFLFPRLISTAFVGLAGWTFAKALLGWSKVGVGISIPLIRNMAPGLGVALIYIFWAAKGLGFYTGTTLAFFALLSLYDPAPHTQAKSWLKRAAITGCFIAVMYVVFGLVLKVFTPREILF